MPPTRGQYLEDFGKWSGVMLRAEMRIDKADPASKTVLCSKRKETIQ